MTPVPRENGSSRIICVIAGTIGKAFRREVVELVPDVLNARPSAWLIARSSGACSLAAMRTSVEGREGGGVKECFPPLKSLTSIHITAYERAHVRHAPGTSENKPYGTVDQSMWRTAAEPNVTERKSHFTLTTRHERGKSNCARGDVPFSQRRSYWVSHNPRTPVTHVEHFWTLRHQRVYVGDPENRTEFYIKVTLRLFGVVERSPVRRTLSTTCSTTTYSTIEK